MKHVYSSIAEVSHIWAHDRHTVKHGRTGNGNYYFEGDVIYSYGAHFPIARLIDMSDNSTVALITTDNYSNSTAKHISYTRRAITHLESFPVPNVLAETTSQHVDNWLAMRSDLNETKTELERSRKPARYLLEECDSQASVCNRYAALFGIENHPSVVEQTIDPVWRGEMLNKIDRTKRINEIELERWAERTARARIAESLEKERTEALQERRELYERLTLGLYKAPRPRWKYGYARHNDSRSNQSRAERRSIAEKVSAWKRNEAGSRLPYGYNGPVLMRLVDDTVQTSAGVRFPASDAAKLWPIIERCKTRGTERHFGHNALKMGSYGVNRIGSDGTVKAGCHTVGYDECRKLAIILGLVQPTTVEVVQHKTRKLAKRLKLAA